IRAITASSKTSASQGAFTVSPWMWRLIDCTRPKKRKTAIPLPGWWCTKRSTSRSIPCMEPKLLLCLALTLLHFPGQTQVPGASGEPARAVESIRAPAPPKIDGTLDDALWQTASVVSEFRQREPFETQPATERTEVRVLYDKRFLYFGVHCYDSEP